MYYKSDDLSERINVKMYKLLFMNNIRNNPALQHNYFFQGIPSTATILS